METMLISTLLFVILASIMVIISNKIANVRLLRKNPELSIDKLWKTTAFVLRRMGLYGGVIIGSFAISKNIRDVAIANESLLFAFKTDVALESSIELISLLIFMFTALRFADWLILSNVDNDNAIKGNNVSLGLTEGAILLGTGFVAYGSFLGEGSMFSSWIFFLIGQIAFILISYLLEYVIHPSHSAKTEIENGDLASGIIVSSMLIVTALFVKNGISGDFHGFYKDVPYFFKILGIQFGFFAFYMFLIEPLIIKCMNLRSLSLAGTSIRTALQIGMAVMIIYNVSL